MADGHLNKCKTCTKDDTAKRVAIKSLDSEWVVKEMERHRIKQQKAREAGTACVLIGEAKRKVLRKYRATYPEKRIAHSIVTNAIRSGTLIQQPCEVCGRKAHAHHDDYSKPLEIRWLCPQHHIKHHVELRKKTKLGITN